MSFIPLGEFQRICALSDAALCWLLKHNKLVCHYDAGKGLLIDSHAVQTKDLVRAIAAYRKELLQTSPGKLQEKFSRLLVKKVSELIEQAFEKAAGTGSKDK